MKISFTRFKKCPQHYFGSPGLVEEYFKLLFLLHIVLSVCVNLCGSHIKVADQTYFKFYKETKFIV